MNPELLPAIAAFERVAHHASFTRAAVELGVSPSALSQSMRTLEKRLGVRLLDRTTRRVGVTEIGQRFLQGAKTGLASLEAAIEGLEDLRDQPSGLLRLNLSRTAADLIVLPHLTSFLDAYPAITLEMNCDNAFVDLVNGGFDAGIRLGENLAQDVVAIPLGGPHRIVTVAAPGYLNGRIAPRAPSDLADHRCLNIRLPTGIYRWGYTQKAVPKNIRESSRKSSRKNSSEETAKDRDFDIEVSGPLIAHDGDTLLSAIRSGAGIGCAFEAQVAGDIARGDLVPLLKAWWPTFPGFYLYHPSRSHVPRKLRVFIDFFRAQLKA